MMKSHISLTLMLIAAAFVTAPTVASSDPISLQSLLVIGQTPSDNTTTTTPTPPPPAHHSYQVLIGPNATVFFPTSSKTADTYGKAWGSIGFGLGSTIHANMRGAFSPYFSILYNEHDNNSALLVPLGISYRKALHPGPISPFIGIQVYALAADQSVPQQNIHWGTSFGYGARQAFGINFTKYFFVEAAYNETSSIRTYNFSGTELEAGLRL